MDYIKMLREDSNLSDLLCDVCDIELLPEFKTPEDESGHLTYNISGKTFAKEGNDLDMEVNIFYWKTAQ